MKIIKKAVLTTLALGAILGVTAHAFTQYEMFIEYATRVDWLTPNDEYGDAEFTIYDIDKNGIPELIVRSLTCEADAEIFVYTYDVSGAVFIGSVPGTHTAPCSCDGNGVIFMSGAQGYGCIDKYEMKNNKLVMTYRREFGPVEDYDPGRYYRGSVDLPVYSVRYEDNAAANLFVEIDDNTVNGVPIGDVLNTDVRTYINGYEIPCFSADGRCVVVAEDLRSYGFNVEWNAETRDLYIEKNGGSFSPVAVGPKGKTGSVFAKILSTDVGAIYNPFDEYIKSYSINGYTLITPESIHGDGISFNYNEQERRLDMYVQ